MMAPRPIASWGGGNQTAGMLERRRRALAGDARRAMRAVLDLVLPPLCPVTGEPIAEAGVLSPAAWERIRFIDAPFCARCGAPFAIDYGEGAECGACLASPPAFDSARAAIVYDDNSHGLVVALKHADRTELAPMFGKWLVRAGRALGRAESVLVPAPLHWRRLAARRFNQAALVGSFAAAELGVRYAPRLLVRTRATPPQKHLSEAARRRNVAGAFAVNEDFRADVEGKPVILVDDVLTTGATLSACSRVLKRAGAARVDALVVARVVRGGLDAI